MNCSVVVCGSQTALINLSSVGRLFLPLQSVVSTEGQRCAQYPMLCTTANPLRSHLSQKQIGFVSSHLISHLF